MSAVGIDLGTSSSLVARQEHGQINLVTFSNGTTKFPSVVSFTPSGRDFGTVGLTEGFAKPENTISGVKRLIGRRFNDGAVTDFIKTSQVKLEEKDEKIGIVVEYRGQRETFTPERISAMILAKIKEEAEDFFDDGETLRNVVISVPAAFSDSQRQATRNAGEIAKLNVLKIVNEPTAAAIAYGFNSDGDCEKNILVYDLGGGTFDVSILKVSSRKNFEVLATEGNLQLGGSTFDQKIFDIIMEMFCQKNNISLIEDSRALFRVMSACTQAKIALSERLTVDIKVNNVFEELDIDEQFSRQQFEEACLPLFTETISIVTRAIKNADLTKEDIKEVVLVGGSSKIPKIKSLLTEMFGSDKLRYDIDPEKAVAIGVAIIANNLEEKDNDNKIVYIERMSASLSTNIENGRVDFIIQKGQRIPAEGTGTYSTAAANQTSMWVHVYEGEGELRSENSLLDSFLIENIPKGPRGQELVTLNYQVDDESILRVTSVIESTQTRVEQVIRWYKRLAVADIHTEVEQEQTCIEFDREECRRNDAKYRLTEKSKTTNNIEMLQWLQENPNAPRSEYERRMGQI